MKSTEENGVALVLTLLVLATLSLLSAALCMVVNSEMRSSAAYKYAQQSFYTANAGVARAVVWFNNGYVSHASSADYDVTACPVNYSGRPVIIAGQAGTRSNYPDATTVAAFGGVLSNSALQADSNNSGTYSVDATLLKHTSCWFLDPDTFRTSASAIERWSLGVRGFWGRGTSPMGTAQLTAVIENSGNPFYDRALWAVNLITLSAGSSKVDSYDSTAGPYGGFNVGDNGNIGTNGSVSLSGGAMIHGDILYGPTGTYRTSGGSGATGQVTQMKEPRVFAAIPDFSVGIADVSLSGKALAIGPGSYGDITVSSGGNLTLEAGTYYFDSLTLSGGSHLTVDGATTIFIKSKLNVSGGSILNTTSLPANLSIFYAGTSGATVSGGSGFYGNIYCPKAALTLSGGTGFFGSFVGYAVTLSGGSQVHYDTDLNSHFLMKRPFRIVAWSQDVF